MFQFALSPYAMRMTGNRGKFTFLGSIARLLLVLWVAEMIASLPTFALLMGQNLSEIIELAEDMTLDQLTAAEYEAAIQAMLLENLTSPTFGLTTYIGLGAVIAGAFFYMLVLDHRPLYQMGLPLEKGQGRPLLLYPLIGALAIGLVVLVNYLSGAVAFTPTTPTLWHLGLGLAEGIASSAYLFFFLGAFLPTILSQTRRFWSSVLWCAVLLGLYLAPPTASTLLGSLNGVLLALVLILLLVRVGHIWAPILAYGTFRILGDVLFGDKAYTYLPEAILDPVLSVGRELTHGGDGGYLGGLAATLILALCLLAVLYFPKKKVAVDTGSFTQSTL